MFTEKEIKKQFAQEIMYVPKQYRSEIRQRYKDGEFDVCRPGGLEHIRYALEFYPEYAERVLKERFRDLKGWDVRNKLLDVIPGFTETPITDAFKKSLEGYLAISKVVMKLIWTLEQYPLQEISEFRRGATIDLMPLVDGKIRWWLGGGDRPGSTLSAGAIDVQASIVSADLPIPDDQSDMTAFPLNINQEKEKHNREQ
jgi:hypothetical protein